MQQNICQSCGIPMGNSNEIYGTNFDGGKNRDYCCYCYDHGQFKNDCTMDEMIIICIPFMLEAHANMSEMQAKQIMAKLLPTLKRWQ